MTMCTENSVLEQGRARERGWGGVEMLVLDMGFILDSHEPREEFSWRHRRDLYI